MMYDVEDVRIAQHLLMHRRLGPFSALRLGLSVLSSVITYDMYSIVNDRP